MGRIALSPGFRFHPTDIELVMYYLKRKVMGKKLHFEAIAEVNIYKFSPWDLPDKSCLKSNDLEWFFFCPREKKYASGVRVKRSTANGYWKTTGKDRSVVYNDNIVGTVKTLIFHQGHAPNGQRTDWVIHEYKILDKQLAEAAIQDTYVLCKVFKKNGPGPKNGAQYGAPFNEADWEDDDDDDAQICSESLPSEYPTVNVNLPHLRNCSVITSTTTPGSTSGLSSTEAGPTSAGPSTSYGLLDDSDHEVVRLLASFGDHSTLDFGEKINHEDHSNDAGNNAHLPGPTENDIYNGLDDLDNWAQITGGGFDTIGIQQDGHLLDQMLPQEDAEYLELNDLMAPLDSSEANATEKMSGNLLMPHSPGNNGHIYFRGIFPCTSQHPLLPEGSNRDEDCLDKLQMANSNVVNVNLGNNNAHGLGFTSLQPTDGGDFMHNLKRRRLDST